MDKIQSVPTFLSAHRFVLSSCSSYLNRVLQLGNVSGTHYPGAPLVVVLPPEISYRTMAILLQYMYSGEATVSNDQLNGVLRAGELLRIKGKIAPFAHFHLVNLWFVFI